MDSARRATELALILIETTTFRAAVPGRERGGRAALSADPPRHAGQVRRLNAYFRGIRATRLPERIQVLNGRTYASARLRVSRAEIFRADVRNERIAPARLPQEHPPFIVTINGDRHQPH
jgi:hypothetical protein